MSVDLDPEAARGPEPVSRGVQVFLAALFVALVVVAALYANFVSVDVMRVSDFTRDATAVIGVPWWTGSSAG